MMRVLLACFLVLGAAAAALAERREALVFGADKYRTLRPLENANGDAEAMKETLEKLGFTVALEEDRNLKRMRRALEDFAEDAAGADVALVFFSGHGVEIAGENRLLPVDADASSLDALQASTLPLEEVRAAVTATARVGLIVLDACRSDPFGGKGGEGRGAVALAPAAAKRIRPGLGRVGRAENILFAFSPAPGETASDGTGENSPFTAGLTKYLATEGLEIRSVLTLVQQAVYDETRGKQLPYVESGLPQTFFASATREQLPERERLLLAMADVTPALRDEVERIAGEADMPLAPLYGALVEADLGTLSSTDRAKKLTEAASSFVKTREELKRLASDDPQVTHLRAQAEESLSLGAFTQARETLAQAAVIDSRSADALAGNLVKRRLSEAATHTADAGVARTQLDYPAAIAALKKAAALHAKVEDEDVPDAARGERSRLLEDLGRLYMLTGDSTKALDAVERMHDAAKLRLAKAPPTLDAERDLAASWVSLGDVKGERGNLADAIIAYGTGREGFARLVAEQPANTGWRYELMESHFKLGNIKFAQGDFSGALAAYEASKELQAQLVAGDPGNIQWQRDLSAIRLAVGDAKRAQGDLLGAVAAYRDDMQTLMRLAKGDSLNDVWQDAFSGSLLRTGDVLVELGNLPKALNNYKLLHEVCVRLAAKDPGDAHWQYMKAVSAGRIGNVKAAQGDRHGALVAYEFASLKLQSLRLNDAVNASWRVDLASINIKLGDIKQAQGDSAGALKAFKDSLGIVKQVVADDPGEKDWQLTLIDLHIKVGNLGYYTRSEFQEALRITLGMQAEGVLPPTHAGLPDNLREALAKLPAAK